MDSRSCDTGAMMTDEEYILSLERRIRTQQEQISRLRRRGRVLMNLLLELGLAREQVKGQGECRVLSLFGDDSPTE